MKRIVSVLLCFALMLSCAPFVSAATADAPVMDGKTLVTFGDSLTALSTWPSSVADALNMNLVNSGIGGNTTAHALARFDRDVAAHDPDFVIMCFGTNDFNRENGSPRVDINTYTANLQTLISKVKALGAIPVLMTPPFITEGVCGGPSAYPEGSVNAGLDTYVNAMRTVAGNNGVLLIDIHTVCNNYNTSSFLVSDGVHLSTQGNSVYTSTIVSFMQSNFNQDPSAPRVEKPVYPQAEPGVWTKPLVSQDINDWLIIYPDDLAGANNADGSVSFWNKNGLWPEVHYSPAPEDTVRVPVKGSSLTIDVQLEAGTNILLFFNGPNPTLAYDNTCSFSLTSYLAKAIPTLQTSYDDILGNQTIKATLSLEDIIPSHLIATDGTVLFTGVKVFAVGAAGKKVTIREMSVSTSDNTVTPENPEYIDKTSLLPTALSQVSRNDGYAAYAISGNHLTITRDAADTLMWPSVKVTCNKAISLADTPYLHLSVTPKDGYANGVINFRYMNGTTGSVQISQLVNGTEMDFGTPIDMYVDLSKYLGSTATVTITDYTLSVYGNVGASVTWNAFAATRVVEQTVTYGDVDGNGAINTLDARSILYYVLGAADFDANAIKAADMNRDGEITTADAREVLLFVVNQ